MKSQKSSKLQKPRRPAIIRQIYGHSMMPVLPPGTIVVGTPWFRKLKPGQIIIFRHNDKEKIKRVEQIEGDRIYVLGDHEDSSTDSRHFGWLPLDTVIARVVWPHAPKHRAEGVEPS